MNRTVDELLNAAAEKRLEVVIDRVFPLRDFVATGARAAFTGTTWGKRPWDASRRSQTSVGRRKATDS
ncbi:hypothetical protein [Rhizobium sullae]|uniref:hypothetical protein n=1 Tax=Rhizobium sullae TaxID=50338 RepID=UPI001FE1FCC4|nr:hypothetical protein [Rhizobium sullae]